MLNHNIYSIKNIWDIQLQHYISNFLTRLNNQDLLGTSTHIRLQQLQNNLWSTINILAHPNPIIDGPNKHTTTFKIIQLLRHLNLTITINPNLSLPHTINHPYKPLEDILNTHSLYSIFKQQLWKKKNPVYRTTDNSILLAW